MKDKNRQLWQGLTMRLWLVVCVTVIPLILGTVILTGTLLQNMHLEQNEIRKRELNLAMSVLENGLEQIEVKMDDVVLKFMTPLTVPSGLDTMVSYEMIEELNKILRDTSLSGVISVQEKSSGHLYIKFTENTYKIEEAKAIRTALERSIIYTTGEWSIRNIAGHYFYLRNYQFANYCLTFRVDLEACFSDLLFKQELTKQPLYFTDGQVILQITPDSVWKIVEKSWNELEDAAGAGWLSWSDEQAGCRLLIEGASGNGQFAVLVFWILFVVVVCIILFAALWLLQRQLILRPLSELQRGMKQLEQEDLSYRIDNTNAKESTEFCYIYDAFNQMAEEISLSHEKDIKMYQAQLDNLRLQVNPHMLLNSFNMIYSLAQTKNFACIQDFSMYLVEYFRYVLKETDALVPLYKEMHFVESYTGIQKIRFPGAFSSVYNIEKGLENAMVPPLLIQNFVENAMKYALIPGKIIEVLINIRSADNRLLISVCDTGSGFKEEVLKKIRSGETYVDKHGQKHIGIWNCQRRMEVFYGASASMNIISERGKGTQVWLDLPLNQDGGGKEYAVDGRG